MPNITVEPLVLADIDSPVQPFLTAGAGLAVNKMEDWTRTNPEATGQAVRTFKGETSYEFAWTIGAGLTAPIYELNGRDAYLDLTYRYLDAGNVAGSTQPLPGEGRGTPNEPFNFDLTSHVVTVALRVPIN